MIVSVVGNSRKNEFVVLELSRGRGSKFSTRGSNKMLMG